MLAMVVVEEIACGRRPPENWKTRIARPTAMSDSLVMRLSFLFSFSYRNTSPYIIFFFMSYPVYLLFSLCHHP
jgi:predicted LPLAT superfamily acyltransferase